MEKYQSEREQNLLGVAEGQIRSADDCQGIDSNKVKAESSFNQLEESGQSCPEEAKTGWALGWAVGLSLLNRITISYPSATWTSAVAPHSRPSPGNLWHPATVKPFFHWLSWVVTQNIVQGKKEKRKRKCVENSTVSPDPPFGWSVAGAQHWSTAHLYSVAALCCCCQWPAPSRLLKMDEAKAQPNNQSIPSGLV